MRDCSDEGSHRQNPSKNAPTPSANVFSENERSQIMRNILQQLLKKSYGTAICMLVCFVAVILFAVGSPQDTAASETSA